MIFIAKPETRACWMPRPGPVRVRYASFAAAPVTSWRLTPKFRTHVTGSGHATTDLPRLTSKLPPYLGDRRLCFPVRVLFVVSIAIITIASSSPISIAPPSSSSRSHAVLGDVSGKISRNAFNEFPIHMAGQWSCVFEAEHFVLSRRSRSSPHPRSWRRQPELGLRNNGQYVPHTVHFHTLATALRNQ